MGIRFCSLVCAAVIASTATTACAGREPRDFGGRWTPANQYATHTEAIPLHGAYVFQASPMDGTLRTLLARWARDSGSDLDYRHSSDFTLHEPVRTVRAHGLGEAVAQLGLAFSAHGVVMRVEGRRLVVTAGAEGS
jgi:hypothetical protein